MTELQIYLLVAPLVLAAVGFSAALWWVRKSDREHPRPR